MRLSALNDNDPSSDGSYLDPDTPLRLADAARLCFPIGTMTVSGLRKEIARGNLAVELIANKHWTTPADIKRMRDLCRTPAKAQGLRSAIRALILANEYLEWEMEQNVSRGFLRGVKRGCFNCYSG